MPLAPWPWLAAVLGAAAFTFVHSSAHAEGAAGALTQPLEQFSTPQSQLLLPPPPPPNPASTQTVQQLEQAEREDSGRGLQFAWLMPDGGFEWVSLGLLSNSKLLDERINEASSGAVLGAGAGLRLLYLTVGARFRYGLLSDFNLWSLGLEGSLRVPQGRWEPYAFVGAGYARASDFKDQSAVYALGTRREDFVISGVNAQLGGGIDYFLTPVFSVGARAEFSALFLGRPALVEADANTGIYGEEGSGIGFGAAGFAVLGLHF